MIPKWDRLSGTEPPYAARLHFIEPPPLPSLPETLCGTLHTAWPAGALAGSKSAQNGSDAAGGGTGAIHHLGNWGRTRTGDWAAGPSTPGNSSDPEPWPSDPPGSLHFGDCQA